MRIISTLVILLVLTSIMAVGELKSKNADKISDATVNETNFTKGMSDSLENKFGKVGGEWGEAIGLTAAELMNSVAVWSYNNPSKASPSKVFEALRYAVYIVAGYFAVKISLILGIAAYAVKTEYKK